MAQLRVYLPIENLQTQMAAFLGAPTTGRGYLPLAGSNSLIIEIAPGMTIHRVIDLALKSIPSVEPGLLFVERQFGILELHSDSMADIENAGKAILKGIKAKATDQLKPKTLFTDIIEDVTDQHAVLVNRTRRGSLITPGECLLLYEMSPALFSLLAANEAEKAAPGINLVEVREIGASGRVFLSGSLEDVTTARDHIEKILSKVKGKEN
jgi:hypothetical protein